MSGSWLRGERLEDDAVAEVLELSDVVVAAPFGVVVAGEVVATEVCSRSWW